MATKVGTAYVDVVANFKPLNKDMRQLNAVSARLGANMRRSMSVVSRDATRAGRSVGRLTGQVQRVGAAAGVSGRQAAAGMREFEASCQRSLRAVRQLQAAQRSLAAVRPAPVGVVGGLAPRGGRGAAAQGYRSPAAAGFDPWSAAAEIGVGATVGGVARPLAKSFGTQYNIVRAFSPGISRLGASKLAVSTMSQAGKFGAQALMGGFTKAIPAAGAAYGVGRTLQAAVEGDLESAAFRGGGTAAGAGIGAGIGTLIAPGPGTVLGGLIGAGLGESAGELLDSIFGGGESGNDKAGRLGFEFADRWGPSLEKAARGKNLSKLRKRRAILRSNLVEAKDSGADDKALAPMRKAVRATEGTIRQIAVPRNTVNKQMDLMKTGMVTRMKDINRMFRTNMMGISQGWNRGTKQWRNVTAQNMHGTVRAIQAGMKKGLISTEVGQNRIKQLHRKIKFVTGQDPYKIADGFKSSWKKAGTINNQQIAAMIREMKTMPKGAREQAQAAMVEMARGLDKGGKLSKGSVARLQSALVTNFGTTNRKVTKTAANLGSAVGGSFRNLAGSVVGALGNIGDNVNSALSAFKVGTVSFPLQEPPGPGRRGRAERQKGGFIVPGSGQGDSFSTALESGSFVLNRRATKAFGFQAGGRVPVMLEPGERVFAPHEVRRHGAGTLQALNGAVPRFQQGGRVPDQRLGGPKGPLRTMGQRGLNRVDRAAERWVRKHSLPRRVARMLSFANRESAKGYDYVYGGGHGQLGVGPYDCSGFVSAILGAGDFVSAPMTVAQGAGLYVLGQAGAGKFFTWGVRGSSGENAHTMMAIKDRKGNWNYFEAGGGGGAGRRSGWNGAFSYRHIPGFQRGGAVGRMPRAAQEAIARYGAAANDPSSPNFVGWGYRLGGSVLKLSKGGGVKGVWAGTRIDKTYPKSDGYSGEQLPFYVAAALGEWAGLPGISMAQIGRSENELHPGTDVPDSPGRSFGWLAIHQRSNPGVTSAAMRNPILNILQAKKIVGSGLPNANIWHATKYVTGYNLHYTAHDPVTIARGLGSGATDGGGNVPAKVTGTYVKYKAGDTSPSGGTYAHDVERKYVALTGRLNFGPVPKDEERCRAELHHLEKKLLPEYRAAVRQSKGATKQALEANLRAIESRIRDLRAGIRSLRMKAATTKLTQRLSAGMKRITGEETAIEEAQRGYEKASQDAEQVVELEPEEPGEISTDWVEKVLTPYIKEKEEPAFGRVLEKERDWRNQIIRSQGSVGAMEFRWADQAKDLKERIGGLGTEIGEDNARIKELRKLIQDHPKAEKRPKWMHERDRLLKQLPIKHERIEAMRGRRKQLLESLDEAKGSWDPWRGTGAFEDSMIQVQGIHWPQLHEILETLPTERQEGMFGGAIRETQRQIEDLKLKIKLAKENAGAFKSQTTEEQLEHEKEMRQHDAQRLAVSEAQFAAFSQFTGSYPPGQFPPYAGKAHSGAIVPGRPGEEKTMIVQGQERIRTPEQELRLAERIKGATKGGDGAAVPQFIVNGDIVQGSGETRDPVEMVLGDRRFPIAVRRVAMGGRITPGGARA